MRQTSLDLPEHPAKPRVAGVTSVIDPGLPTGMFADAMRSFEPFVDFVKFGWGSAVVTPDLEIKLDVLASLGIDHYFGGSLFEKYVLQDRLADFRAFCHHHGCRFVEVSNGTIELSNRDKAGYISELCDEFAVISEVGYKDPQRSAALGAEEWVTAIREDLAAGACLVTTEARESGRSGICTAEGALRDDLVETLLGSGLEAGQLLFEAPTTELQAYFVRRLGPAVNLANIPALGVLSLESLRLGLRGDTLTTFEPAAFEPAAFARAAFEPAAFEPAAAVAGTSRHEHQAVAAWR